MCLNTGILKNINFSFETNGKLMALGVQILKHFRVYICISVLQITRGDNSRILLFLNEKKCCDPSLGLSQLDSSNKGAPHKFVFFYEEIQEIISKLSMLSVALYFLIEVLIIA